jgi:hypothetical protein
MTHSAIATIGIVSTITPRGIIVIDYPYSSKDSALRDAIDIARAQKTVVTLRWSNWLKVYVCKDSIFSQLYAKMTTVSLTEPVNIGP